MDLEEEQKEDVIAWQEKEMMEDKNDNLHPPSFGTEVFKAKIDSYWLPSII